MGRLHGCVAEHFLCALQEPRSGPRAQGRCLLAGCNCYVSLAGWLELQLPLCVRSAFCVAVVAEMPNVAWLAAPPKSDSGRGGRADTL